MRMNKLLTTSLAIVLAFVAINFWSNSAYANCGRNASGADQTCGGGGSSGGHGSCAGGNCNSVIYSGATGWNVQTVTSPNMQLQGVHSIDYGHTHYHPNKADFTTGNTRVGAKFYSYALYANKDGYVNIDGVRTYVQKGQLLTIIPVAGLPDGNGGYIGAFSYLNSKGWYGDIPQAEVLAIYKQMVDAGLLEDLSALLSRSGFGGLEDGETPPPCEVLALLFPGLRCDGDPPTVTHPKFACTNGGSHAGDTAGTASVSNLTKNENTTFAAKGNTVWARPGDSIRFEITYCWSVGRVGGSMGSASSPYALGTGSDLSTGGAVMTPELAWYDKYAVGNKPIRELHFQIESSHGDDFLFGDDEQAFGSRKYQLISPRSSTIGAATGFSNLDNHTSYNQNYQFALYSPTYRSVDATSYNCQIFDFPPFFVQGGYQAPGIATGTCAAAEKTTMSVVGQSVSQTIRYNLGKAWQLYKHEETGDCIDNCTALPPEESYHDPVSVDHPELHEAYNTLTENNQNTIEDPFQSMESALSTSGKWGLISKHAEDTDVHERDCDDSRCACDSWMHTYLCSSGCCRTPTYPCNCDDDGNCDTCGGDAYPCLWTVGGCVPGSSYEDGSQPCNGECESFPGKKYYFPGKNYPTAQAEYGERSQTATVNIPYSYRTEVSAEIQEGDVIYLGESVSSFFTASILPRAVTEVRGSEEYATLVDAEIRAVEFVISPTASQAGIQGSSMTSSAGVGSGQDPCTFYRNQYGSQMYDCQSGLWGESGGLNPEGRYRGRTYSGTATRAVPDIYPVGSKYCVAVGISSSDSHGIPDSSQASGMDHRSGWRVSPASCRTIAKKPNFQVWNGNMYNHGSMRTSITNKRVDAHLGVPYEPNGMFGSWEEYLLNSYGTTIGFASGATLGYYGYSSNANNSMSLGLMGGHKPFGSSGGIDGNVDYCDLVPMTIANEDVTIGNEKYSCKDGVSGNSKIDDPVAVTKERIRSRYLGTVSNGIQTLDNGAVYVHSANNIAASQLANLSYTNGTSTPNTRITSGEIRQMKGSQTESTQTTRNYASNVLVIHVDKDFYIDRNICTGDGSCKNMDNALVLLNRNNVTFNNIYSIPQILIVVDGNITISSAVTQIDAWIITSGTINTCDGKLIPNIDSQTCDRQLIFNGPVYAKSVQLSRTSGADPGQGNSPSANRANPIQKNLSDDGSIQPAEIFNLRPDALYWAYSQAQRFSQANVTYTRELAPRY